mmetsp:Transcript_29143/g.63340  ORF Transcript_29143/g.63340 Transcript_29143/m.63340 type:complete len:258 (-) Transcript_29143:86-859(-)
MRCFRRTAHRQSIQHSHHSTVTTSAATDAHLGICCLILDGSLRCIYQTGGQRPSHLLGIIVHIQAFHFQFFVHLCQAHSNKVQHFSTAFVLLAILVLEGARELAKMPPFEEQVWRSCVYLQNFPGKPIRKSIVEDLSGCIKSGRSSRVIQCLAHQDVWRSNVRHELRVAGASAVHRQLEFGAIHGLPLMHIGNVISFHLPVLQDLLYKGFQGALLMRHGAVLEVGLVHLRVVWPPKSPRRALRRLIVANQLSVCGAL